MQRKLRFPPGKSSRTNESLAASTGDKTSTGDPNDIAKPDFTARYLERIADRSAMAITDSAEAVHANR